MGELKDVNRDDLLNRFANHSFTETPVFGPPRVDSEHIAVIDTVSDSGGTARFNFASGPTLVVGQRVINSDFTTNTDYNGTHVVAVTDGTTYFEVTGISFGTTEVGTLTPLIGDQTRVDFEHDDVIDTVSDSTGTARFNFAAGPTLVVGQRVINSGFTTNTDYNGTHIVSATDGTTYFEVTGISFGTTEVGSLAALIGSAQSVVVDIAYQRIRQELVGGGSILLGDFTFQGSTKFGGLTTIAPNGAIDVVGGNAATTRIRSVRFQDTATGAAALQLGHSRGSEGSPSALLSGDLLGQLRFVGDDGATSNGAGADIFGVTTEAWGGSAKGCKLTFETIKPGTTSAALAFTVSDHGYPEAPTYTVATLPNVGIGGGMILVSDETGGATLAFSDGTNWRRVQDRAIVA